MRRLETLGFFGLAVASVLALAPATGGFSELGGSQKRACNSINLGEVRVFYKHNMRCSSAKHYARRLYKTDGQDWPRNFTCESGSDFNEGGACRHDVKDKYFGWHPGDKVGASATGPNRGNQKVYGVEDCGEPEVKPDRIVFACADFGLYANHFDWKNWGHRKTTTDGVLHAKVCEPDCASGYFEGFPVEIVLRKIKTWTCNGVRARFYRKIKLSFPGAQPDFTHGPPNEFFCL